MLRRLWFDYQLFRLWGNTRIGSVCKAILAVKGERVYIYPKQRRANGQGAAGCGNKEG